MSNNNLKNLEEGCFYFAHEGSKTGHPGMIYWKNDNRNLYLAITTGTTEEANDHFQKLSKSTSQSADISFVNKRPFLGKRRDFSGKKKDMKFSVNDYNIIVSITKRKARESSSIRSKDRKFYKKVKPQTEIK